MNFFYRHKTDLKMIYLKSMIYLKIYFKLFIGKRTTWDLSSPSSEYALQTCEYHHTGNQINVDNSSEQELLKNYFVIPDLTFQYNTNDSSILRRIHFVLIT